jgi:hypothetical protein
MGLLRCWGGSACRGRRWNPWCRVDTWLAGTQDIVDAAHADFVPGALTASSAQLEARRPWDTAHRTKHALARSTVEALQAEEFPARLAQECRPVSWYAHICARYAQALTFLPRG